jgi:levansucrase
VDPVALAADAVRFAAPKIDAAAVVPMVAGLDLWDIWPIRELDGRTSIFGGDELWMGLSAPATGDPGRRHAVARIRFVRRHRGGWEDLGQVIPEGSSVGSREWAGCAVHDRGLVTLFYTAAGSRDEPRMTFEQRIAVATAELELTAPGASLKGWSAHTEPITADGVTYAHANETTGEPGFIKAFRDPFFFRDPDTLDQYILFTGSLGQPRSTFCGAIGIAFCGRGGAWSLRPPLVQADGVNNELERPHVVVCDELYYLFFSTQRRTFHPDVPGATGLYGLVSERLLGPYEPLNGSGLVLANPPDEPWQTYSWLVLDDLRVVSFVDTYALAGRTPDDLTTEGLTALRRHFGGTIAPVLSLRLDGRTAVLAEGADRKAEHDGSAPALVP